PLGESVRECIERSTIWWQNWAQRASYKGPYREVVVRSALALKLLTYAPSGAMVAAITTSLPERIGGDLNWDYRYCWLRDASLTARALLGLGYHDEVDAFVGWLLETTALTRPKLRASYTLYGDRPPRERELNHLCGYRGSRPVRVGNAARDQLQLDVYGEVVDAALQFFEHDGDFDNDAQKILAGIGQYVARNWRQPDEGIWEPRTGRQNHTYSRLLCWTALDGLLRLHEHGAVRSVPVENLCSQREQIRAEIQARAWNEKLQSYVTVMDGDDVDASLLLIPWYAFESADSPRMQATYRRI